MAHRSTTQPLDFIADFNFYSGCKIMLNQMTVRQRGRTCKRARTGGGARATTSCMRSIRTRGGSRAVLSQIPLPIVGDIDGRDKDMQESDKSSNSNNANGTTGADPWKNENPTLQSFPFEENSGMNVNIPDGDDPSFYLRLLLTDELIKSILQCTNVYAQRVINSSRPLRRRSVLNEWRNVTEEEIKKFLGLILHMGLVSMPTYCEYWSKSRLYSNELFPSVMPRERFQVIMRFLHFGEDPQYENDCLSKICLLSNHFNKTMNEVYTPSKMLSLDESMMLWRGRLVFQQHIQNKKHKYGIKFFELSTFDGLVLNIEAYSDTIFQDTENLGQTGAIVLHLMSSYFDKGYHLFADNWYNSVSLTEYMSRRKTYITGPLRGDRKQNPKEVINKNLRKGDMVFQSLRDISVTKWKKQKRCLCVCVCVCVCVVCVFILFHREGFFRLQDA